MLSVFSFREGDQRFSPEQSVFSFAEARQEKAHRFVRSISHQSGPSDPSVTSQITSVQFGRFVMTQNPEEIVVLAAALSHGQGITMQGETDVDMPHPPRSPVARPIWEPQYFQAREPTTFELMGMIGDLQRSVADLTYGMSASPSTTLYVGNFMSQEPPLLGRIVIEFSQHEAASSFGTDMSTAAGLCTGQATQTSHQAAASGKNKEKVDTNPYEQLQQAVEALKVGGLNKQQVLAVVANTVDDIFPTRADSSSSQVENRDGDRRTKTVPSNPNPAPGKDQRAKAASADPFASASGKSQQTSKYLPRGRRAFHALYMPFSKALQILVKKGHLKPLEPRPLTNPLPAKHDGTQYCAYHQQTGHTTDNCFRLRHEVQDLFDNGVVLPPSSAKSTITGFCGFVLSLSHCFESVFLLKGLSCCIESVLLYKGRVIPGVLPQASPFGFAFIFSFSFESVSAVEPVATRKSE
ncbi:hypothetical protein ACSBR1_005839 [Camellia fascicularis]